MFKREWYKWVEQCQTHLQFPAAIYDKYSGHFLYTPGDSYLSTLLTVKKKNIGIVLNKLPEEKTMSVRSGDFRVILQNVCTEEECMVYLIDLRLSYVYIVAAVAYQYIYFR